MTTRKKLLLPTSAEDLTEAKKLLEAQIPADVAKLVDFIPKKRYMELYKETDAAINNRIARGHWTLGVHYNRPEGGGTWISIKAVNAWAAQQVP